jgi:hypothetical protein
MYKLVSCNLYILLYFLSWTIYLDSEYFAKTVSNTGLLVQGMMFFSFRVNFFSKLNTHPHDSWVEIIKRMYLNVFQYKLLIIPSNQDNHKSLFVITGLQNVVAYCHRFITSDHPCILHLDPARSVLESSLAVLTANNIRLLLNKLYRSHVGSNNNKVVNAFTSRSMLLRRPRVSKYCVLTCITIYFWTHSKFMRMNINQYACQNMTSTLVSGLFVMFIVSLDLQEIPLLKKMSTLSVKEFFQQITNLLLKGQI